MRAMAALLVLVAVGLLVVSGFCPPGTDCVHSFGHALFMPSTGSALSFSPGVIASLSPKRTAGYDDVVGDPTTPPPRA